jgi:type I restriction enzyme S subunit
MASEDELQLLPDGWSIKTLGELCDEGGGDIQTGPFGSQLHSADYVSAGVPSIMPTNILVEGIQAEGIARITRQDAERLQRYRVRTGDIIYSRRGDVEKCALVTDKEDGWLCGTGCLRVRIGKAPTNPDFVHAYLSSPSVRAWVVRHSIGATMPNLNTGILRNLPVSLPPPVEMQSIGTIWTALINKTNQLASMNRKLEAIARAIFKSWFVDFDPVRAKAKGREPEGMDAATAALFPSEFEDSELGEIPLGWKVKSIGDISISNRKSIGKDYAHPEIEYVDISSVEPGRITSTLVYSLAEAPSRAKRLVRDGDTIWSCVRPNRRSYALVIEPTDSLVVSTGFVTLTATEVPFSFLYLSVTTSQFVEYLTLRADGAAYPAVRPDTFESAKVTIPAKSIANRFHEIVEPILRTIAANDRQATTLAELRDTLLPRLISGKLRVPDAEAMLMEVV